MPVKTTEYAFIPKAVLRRTSRSRYAARRKCLRPNPGPPKSEGLVLRIYTYDKYRRTHARNPLKKRVSVKKSSAFLLTKIKTKTTTPSLQAVLRACIPASTGLFRAPAVRSCNPQGRSTACSRAPRPVPGARTLKRRRMTRRTPAGRFPRQGRPPQASSARLPGVLGRSGGVLGAFRRASTGLPRVSAVPQASGAPSELRPGDRPRRSTEGIGTRAAPLPACTRPPGGPRRPLISTLQQHQCVTSGA